MRLPVTVSLASCLALAAAEPVPPPGDNPLTMAPPLSSYVPGSNLGDGLIDAGNDAWVGHGWLGVGARQLPSAWEGLDQALAIDLDYDVRRSSWPIAIAAGLHGAFAEAETDDDRDFELALYEIALGVAREQVYGALRLDAAVFATATNVQLDSSRYEDDDWVLGAAGQLQVAWTWGTRWHAGLRGRYAWTEDVDLILADEEPLTGLSALIVLGVSF